MSLKICAVLVALFSVCAVLVHEYSDNSYDIIMKYPFVKEIVRYVHNFYHKVKRLTSIPATKPEAREKLFTVSELSKYSGKVGSPGLYLAILGKVYDVEKGKKYYGEGGSYHVFAGRDASKSFVTGDFTQANISDDVSELSLEELRSLYDWSQFYHETYEYKGKLVGRYYDSNGFHTSYHELVSGRIKQAGEERQMKTAEHMKYPPCNVEWTPENGSKVWCSKRSGGIERDWVGVPRKFFKPGSSSYRCACIQVDQAINRIVTSGARAGNLEMYDNCAPDSTSCVVEQ